MSLINDIFGLGGDTENQSNSTTSLSSTPTSNTVAGSVGSPLAPTLAGVAANGAGATVNARAGSDDNRIFAFYSTPGNQAQQISQSMLRDFQAAPSGSVSSTVSSATKSIVPLLLIGVVGWFFLKKGF